MKYRTCIVSSAYCSWYPCDRLDVPSEDEDWAFQPSVRESELMWERGRFSMSYGISELSGRSLRSIFSFLSEFLFLMNCQGTTHAPMMINQYADVTIDGECGESEL